MSPVSLLRFVGIVAFVISLCGSVVDAKSRKTKRAVPDVVKPACSIGAPTETEMEERLQYKKLALWVFP